MTPVSNSNKKATVFFMVSAQTIIQHSPPIFADSEAEYKPLAYPISATIGNQRPASYAPS
jgi:hypothetical protein